ncbi:MAG TPA: hypothetical protein VM243_17180 [Phycisphaerae bacterium]|nr:hypothetical protein [Phycisphaerae bacterium]
MTGPRSAIAASHADGFVADLLPATAPPPEPARRVNFFKALLLFWLLPRRYGPHLAVGSMRRALAAHGVAVLLAGAIPALPYVGEAIGWADMDMSLHDLRVALAEQVLELAQTSAFGRVPWAVAVMVLGAVPLGEVALVLVATAAMPWCAGGDRASSVWKRSVKNVYWSTTVVIPTAVIVALGYGVDLGQVRNDGLVILLGLLTLIVPPVVILRMLVVGAGRYVGVPDGPAFAPREPRCESCGYTLIRLPAQGRCPECGVPIGESLPGGRRRPTVWQQKELRPRGFVELIRLQWVILRDPAFFDRLPVHSGLAAARHFWWGTFLLMVFTLLAAAKIGSLATVGDQPWQMVFAGVAAVAVIVPFPLQAAMMSFACLWSQFRSGISDYRASAVVCYYAAPLMWPLVLGLVLAAVVAGALADSALVDLKLHVGRSGEYFTAWHLAMICVFVLTIALLLFWGGRLLAALRSVRYANV